MKIPLSITTKLLFSIFTAGIAVALIQTVAMRTILQGGFLDYLNQQGYERMEKFMPTMEEAYREHGNWKFLRGNISGWFHALRPGGPPEKIPPSSVADETGAIVRMGLLDRKLHRITGNGQVGPDSIRRPVKVDGKIVAWLAMVPFQHALAANEAHFVRQQRDAWLIIGAVSVPLMLFLTFIFSLPLRRRVRDLTRATHALAAGEYRPDLNHRSGDELDILARDFNRMANTLAKTENSRRIFMADISHELRTPLSTIRVETESIQDNIRSVEDGGLDTILRELQRMDRLINDLHDLSMGDMSIKASTMQPIDLALVLSSSLENMKGRFQSAGLHSDLTIRQQPIMVMGDEARLHQLFANFLENALRYTDAGGWIRVSCRLQSDRALIVIEDSAPGVPENQLSRIFERFYRLDDSRSRASGGSGLGLAICENIVRQHRGKIEAARSSLGGLCINLQIPVIPS